MTSLQLQSFDENQFKEMLLHYKKFYVSLGIIFCSVILLFWVILPQIQQYSDQRAQIQETKARIAILQKNIVTIEGINNEDQASSLETTLRALPQDKDYAGVLYAVRSASAKAGVGVDDFAFSVGELSAKNIITQTIPTLSLSLHLIGSPAEISRFLTELAKTLPLSNVTEITLDAQSANIVVQFYYKPIPQLRVNYTQPVAVLSQVNNDLLKNLSSWESAQPLFDINPVSEDSVASQSASPFAQ